MKTNFVLLILFFLSSLISSGQQTALIGNPASRKVTSLNGKWQYIVDPYETGFYDYRWLEKDEKSPEAYWNTDIPANKTDRKEHGYIAKYSLNVPGDWNSQDPKFLYYEGTVWYKKSFDFLRTIPSGHVFLYFGAVNYRADVYLNGKKLGTHKGGFTPFNFEIPDSVLKPRNNYLVVKVDNKRFKDEIPTLNTDWWNYGGITRDVLLIEVPGSFIENYVINLEKPAAGQSLGTGGYRIEGWVKVNRFTPHEKVEVEIPELKVKNSVEADNARVSFRFTVPSLSLWSPENPKLYRVIIRTSTGSIQDKIGFRTIEVDGSKILLNGEPIFLRGICMHEENPLLGRRAYSHKDALQLLGWAKELSANMVRLAHYPHNENMTRMADSLGILVWSEIPVYWTINFGNAEVLEKAKNQLREMIARDQNRASIIIWSVGNETPVSETRTNFMKNLVQTAKELDGSRLVSAALEIHNANGVNVIDDPLGQYTDLVAVNEYIGWYSGTPDKIAGARWEVKYSKPLFFSETGAEALGGYHADSLTRWSEEYQAWYYKEQIAMMKKMPGNYSGLSPWILADFRSPRRNNPVYQEGWNNKGLIDQKGRKKKAFFVLKKYYDEIRKQ